MNHSYIDLSGEQREHDERELNKLAGYITKAINTLRLLPYENAELFLDLACEAQGHDIKDVRRQIDQIHAIALRAVVGLKEHRGYRRRKAILRWPDARSRWPAYRAKWKHHGAITVTDADFLEKIQHTANLARFLTQFDFDRAQREVDRLFEMADKAIGAEQKMLFEIAWKANNFMVAEDDKPRDKRLSQREAMIAPPEPVTHGRPYEIPAALEAKIRNVLKRFTDNQVDRFLYGVRPDIARYNATVNDEPPSREKDRLRLQTLVRQLERIKHQLLGPAARLMTHYDYLAESRCSEDCRAAIAALNVFQVAAKAAIKRISALPDHRKPRERELIEALAFDYCHAFKRMPSAANNRPGAGQVDTFMQLLNVIAGEFGTVIGQELAADVVDDCREDLLVRLRRAKAT